MPVDEDGAVRHIVGAQDQIHQGGLAGAGLAHQAHVLASGDGEGHVLQRVILALGIAEGQVAELNVALHIVQRLHIGAIHHILLGVQ